MSERLQITPPFVMTAAGSDSSACAGIQADIKTFSALGVYGASVITALTAQNTRGVSGIFDVSAEFVAAQLDAVFDDIEIVAVKTGMLPSAEIVATVARKFEQYAISNVVVDPVMVTTTGDRLISDEAVQAVKEHLLPLATIVTPNVVEAQILSGITIDDLTSMNEAARVMKQFGNRCVLIKGGHLNGSDSVDVLFDGERFRSYSSKRIDTQNTHGTGCTLSAAIAAFLGHGEAIDVAVQKSKDYITAAIANAFPVGHGAGPVHHFHKLWRT